MKRFFNYIACALCLLAIAACEDVPAPYEINNNGSAVETIEPAGAGTLTDPYNVVKALNLIKAGENDPNADVYVKGIISQNDGSDNLAQYGNMTYYISDNGKTAKQLEVYRGYGLDGKKFTSLDDIALGDTVIVKGKLVMYGSTAEFTQGSSIVYQSGKSGTPTPPVEITGDNLLQNGDFEAWEGGQPTNWKSASTAGNATLSQSTDAHSGSYSVKVGFNETQNKRLAYKEITLKAGTYEWSFYAKATTSEKSQCQGGYVPVTNGTAGDYSYLGYVSLNNTGWTLVSGTFTLDAQTTVCLLVMNPKTSSYATAQDILVDDASLKTNDGGIVEGGNDTPDKPDTPTPGDDNVLDVAAALAILAAMDPAAQTSEEYTVTGKVESVTEISAQYGNATFVLENGLTVFRTKSFGGASFTDENAIKAGDEVKVKGYLKNYVDKNTSAITPELINGTLIELNGNTEGENNGGDEPNVNPGDGSEKVITFTAGVDRGSVTSDNPGPDQVTKNGVTISITSGCLGNNDNYRTYKSQSMTVSADSNIASIVFTCTADNDTKYGPGCWTADKGSYTYEDKVGTWTGDAKSVTFNAASNQVRATKIVVTLK